MTEHVDGVLSLRIQVVVNTDMSLLLLNVLINSLAYFGLVKAPRSQEHEPLSLVLDNWAWTKASFFVMIVRG